MSSNRYVVVGLVPLMITTVTLLGIVLLAQADRIYDLQDEVARLNRLVSFPLHCTTEEREHVIELRCTAPKPLPDGV